MEGKQKSNPFDSAGIFSRAFFCWLFPIIIKGTKHRLKEEDLFEISKYHSSEYLGNMLQKEWNEELQKRNPNILKAVLRLVGWKFLTLILLILVQETAVVAGQVHFLGVTVHYFDNRSEWNPYNIYLSIAGFFAMTAMFFILYNTNYIMTELIGMNLKIAFCTIIYRKAMRLSSSSLEKSNVGQMVNLIANDVSKFQNNINGIPYLFSNPFLIITTIAILWQYYGWTILVGFLAIFLFIPIQFVLSKLYSKFRLQAAVLGDKRLNLLNEMIADMRLIKMYTWELPYVALVEKFRKKEMKKVRMFLYARGVSIMLGYPICRLFTSLTYLAFFLNGGQLNAQIAYITMALSAYIFGSTISLFSRATDCAAEVLVSSKRLQDFLLLQEKDDETLKAVENSKILTEYGIWMNNVTATWKKETYPTLKDISINVQPGELLTVVGPVGSGKTSFLLSILGEIPVTSGKVIAKGKIAYASQEAWVFNGSIRENILFGEEYEEEKYKKVLYITALEKDLSLFPKGDLTTVGERGVIMSGGQKARINLARALYLDADVFLLDDPLSAVDVPVAKHIFEKCIMEYLNDKICILVTHQVQFLNFASKILVLNKEKYEIVGNYNRVENLKMLTGISSDNEIAENRIELETALLNDDKICESTQSHISDDIENSNNSYVENENKKVPPDDVEVGTIETSVYKEYLNAGSSFLFRILLLLMLVVVQSITNVSDYWLMKWYATGRSPLSSSCDSTAPMAALDASVANTEGKVLNRFSKDVNNVDDNLPNNVHQSLKAFFLFAGMCVLQAILCPYVFILTFVITMLLYAMWTIHSRVLKSIKIIEGKSRSPVFSHLSVSLYGLTTIRAFNAENKFISTFNEYQDNHTATWIIYISLNRCLSIYGNIVCYINLLITVIIFSISIHPDDAGSQIGLVMSYALLFVMLFQTTIRYISEVDFQMNSVKRILKYSKLKSEASYESSSDKQPPADWPQKGEIYFDNVSLQYSKDKNIVLKNLTFRIHSGEKIGIVGRTGAGKSSIIASLFRMTEPTGTITIDGIDTKDIGLRDLRSKISIIPQDPMLFTGPLRRNIDPFNEYSDEILWKAIEEVQLKEVISTLPGGLDTHLSEGGRNFSVGERQLICLARTILRKNKILVMDEATSNIDKKTDSCIQKIIREKFKSCTVLTIAHRLHTIIDSDRVLVLDNGKLQEFDRPYKLLKNVNGTFYNLVKNSGVTLMNELFKIAENKYYVQECMEITRL
ncbi:multidrug resistance-associated protein 4-like [Centruroides sculpturatus]|uniref:multidrug resistance-associated protein 4-like n=1 Tax=Centruroides sculpturatus TaxID=218467 RepID=UPI000C6E2861|nr:multidrug resistance-associated protein 4-like [Centruroides sculpturatus]